MARNFGFTFGRTEEGQRRDYEELEKRLKEQPNIPNPTTPANQNIPPVSTIPIANSGSYWRIPVNYRNGIYTVDLAKSLLDNGTSKTQKDWAEYRKIAEPKGEFYTGDMPLYHSIFTSLFKQKNKPESEEARKFIQESMRKWLMTLTRIAYQPKGKDKVIHNYETKDKYESEENIVNPDRIIETVDSKALEAILGTGDVSEIKNVYNWINGTDTYIWRLNSKPKKVDERIARFGADSDWALLGCDRDADGSYPSLGVRIVEASGASGSAKK